MYLHLCDKYLLCEAVLRVAVLEVSQAHCDSLSLSFSQQLFSKQLRSTGLGTVEDLQLMWMW